MIVPNLEDVKKMCGQYTVVPVCKEIFSDIKTPIELLRLLKEKSNKKLL